MRVVLRRDWDIPISPPIFDRKVEGYFGGRDKELAQLVNEILRRKRGSILISGYPGVGKTSLVYKALSEAKREDRNIIIVLLNAGQLRAESEDIDSRKIIENLIRRLYSAIKDSNLKKKLKEEIESLYRKTVAKEFKLEETFQKQQELSHEMIEEETREVLLTGRHVVFITSWTFAVVLQFAEIIPIELLNNLIPLLLAFPVPYGASMLYKKHSRKSKIEDVKRKAAELYQFDNSVGNLEFDLEKIHREISRNGKKLIYVIDELDKLDPATVKEVLGFFKNLFTLSDALFVFVTGEEIYNIEKPKKEGGIYRAKEYTYFTSKYFLHRPLYEDLSKFLDNIVEKNKSSEDEFELLKRSLCFEARNDFFDLKNCIKDRIENFDKDSKPVIELEEIEEDDEQKARFHKAVTALFERKYMSKSQSKWIENENLLRSLFRRAHGIYSSYAGAEHNDPEDDKVESEMIREFHRFLHRLEALELGERSSKTIRGLEIYTANYTYAGNIPMEPPFSLDETTEFEQRFMKGFEEYCSYILALNNAFKAAKDEDEVSEEDFWENPGQFIKDVDNWRSGAYKPFMNHSSAYMEIKNKDPNRSYNKEEIEKRTARIESNTKDMLTRLPTIMAYMLQSLYEGYSLQVSNLRDNASLFSDSARPIRNSLAKSNPPVAFKKDFSHQILLINDRADIIEKVKNEIRDNSSTHMVVCITDKKDLKIDGLQIVTKESPEDLKISIIELLKNTKDFLHVNELQ